MLKIAALFAIAMAASSAGAQSMECQKAKRELSISTNIQSLAPAEKRIRMNAAIAQVNAACGTNMEQVKEPKRDFLLCTGDGPTKICQ